MSKSEKHYEIAFKPNRPRSRAIGNPNAQFLVNDFRRWRSLIASFSLDILSTIVILIDNKYNYFILKEKYERNSNNIL